MINLLLAVLCSSLVSIIMRLSEGRVKGRVSMLAMNYLMCMAVAGSLMGFGNIAPAIDGVGRTAALGLFNGVLYLASFILLQLNVRKNGVVLSSIFMRLGLLVPMVLSVIAFGERPGAVQIAGFGIAVAAILLINSEKQQTQMSFRAGLILLLLIGGCADGMSKVFEEVGNSALSSQFLFYTFGAALILCVGLMLCRRERPGLKEAAFGLLIGVPNYFSSRFLLLALKDIPAVIAYPTVSVATIVLVSLAGVCFFRERLGRRQWIAIGAILVSLVLLNI